MLQNEFNSNVARFNTHIKPVLPQRRLLTGLNEGGKTGNIALQNSFKLEIRESQDLAKDFGLKGK